MYSRGMPIVARSPPKLVSMATFLKRSKKGQIVHQHHSFTNSENFVKIGAVHFEIIGFQEPLKMKKKYKMNQQQQNIIASRQVCRSG